MTRLRAVRGGRFVGAGLIMALASGAALGSVVPTAALAAASTRPKPQVWSSVTAKPVTLPAPQAPAPAPAFVSSASRLVAKTVRFSLTSTPESALERVTTASAPAVGSGLVGASTETGTLPATATAPGLPLRVAATTAGAASAQLLDATRTAAAGVKGGLFTLTLPAAATAARGAAGSTTKTAPAAAKAAAAASPVVSVDTGVFAGQAGGDFAARLHLVQMPSCAVTTPQVTACRVRTPLTTNRTRNGWITARLATPSASASSASSAQPMVIAAVSGTNGGAGDYAATSLTPASSWSVSGASGSFDWSYPVSVPPTATGGAVAPSVGLSYGSGSLDGQVSSTNNQVSWVGEGWDYQPGYIERSYRSCKDDKDAGPLKYLDLCWGGQVLTVNLGGKATSLVQDDTTKAWHPANDDGERVERLTGASNGARNGEYWRITTTDGIQYYFGRQLAPGATTAQSTNSTWTVPVIGAQPGDDCYNSTTGTDGSAARLAASTCTQAWRWNLDYVEDPHHGAAIYSYNTPETNRYSVRKGGPLTSYMRGGTLKQIDYGMLNTGGSVYGTPAPARIVFDTAERCTTAGTMTCSDAQFTFANRASWPDTPQDLDCPSTTPPGETACTVSNAPTAPTFWSRKHLTTIRATVRDTSVTGGYRTIDSYKLNTSFSDDASPTLRLDSILHTGSGTDQSGGTDIDLPLAKFGYTAMFNRVQGYNNQGDMTRRRLTGIFTETGASTVVSYSAPQCTTTAPVLMPNTAALQSNTTRCFPVYWTPDYATDPILDFFHKYVVTEVTTNSGSGVPVRTMYNYGRTVTTGFEAGYPAWHYSEDELTPTARRTYGQWRGYDTVEVRTGDPDRNEQQTLTTTRYFRGMNGDRLPSGTRTVKLTDSQGGVVADENAFADTPFETVQYAGSGGSVLSRSIATPVVLSTTATRALTDIPDLVASLTGTASTRTLTTLVPASAGTAVTTSSTSYDALGRVVRVSETGTDVPSRCTETSYASPPVSSPPASSDSWIHDRVAQTTVAAQACPATGTALAAGKVVSRSRVYFDSSTTLGAVPGPGDATSSQSAVTGTAPTEHYAVTTTTYDAYGRPLTITADPGDGTAKRTTTTKYTPDGPGRLQSSMVTNAAGHVATTTVSTDRGQPTRVEQPHAAGATGAAVMVTDVAYDALGRTIAVWKPGQAKPAPSATTGRNKASVTYTYKISTLPLAVTTKTLVDTGVDSGTTNYVTAIALMDGAGNTLQTQTEGEQGGSIVSDTIRDTHGWVTRTNQHWINTVSPKTAVMGSPANTDQPSYTTTTYDGAGRPTWVRNWAKGVQTDATRTVYGGNKVTTLPPTGGVAQSVITDVRGQALTQRQYQGVPTVSATGDDVTGGNPLDTSTVYDALGRVVTATDSSSHAWSFGYDLGGRKFTQTDPDVGTSSSTYNDLGEVTTTTDARGKVQAYKYDKLGRKVGQYQTSLTGTQISGWLYDTMQVGELTESTRYTSDGNYVVGVTGYDAVGNPTGSKIVIPPSQTGLDGTYTTSQTWTTTHLPRTTTTADAPGALPEQLTTDYSRLGHPVMLDSDDNGFVRGSVLSPTGLPNQLLLGANNESGWLNYVYDPQTLRQVTAELGANTTDRRVDRRDYTYDDAGNITKTVNAQGNETAPPTQTTCYTYDRLRQLTQAWSATDNCTANPSTPATGTAGNATVGGPQPFWTTWKMTDGLRTEQVRHALRGATGNAATDTTTTYQRTDTTHPHFLTATTTTGPGTNPSAGTTTATPDAAGNTKTRNLGAGQGTQTFTYDQAGRTSTIATTAGTTSYTLDADGNQLIRRDPDAATLYLGGTEIKRTTTGSITATRYYSLGGITVGLRFGTGNPRYVQTDNSGTPTVEMRFNDGVDASTRRFTDPYGNPTAPTTGGTWYDAHSFLNKPTSTTTGLVDVGAREYDPTTGSFLSPDPVLNLGDPLSLNGYAYAGNNPITYSDPTGLMHPPDWAEDNSTPPGGSGDSAVAEAASVAVALSSAQVGRTGRAAISPLTKRLYGKDDAFSNFVDNVAGRHNNASALALQVAYFTGNLEISKYVYNNYLNWGHQATPSEAMRDDDLFIPNVNVMDHDGAEGPSAPMLADKLVKLAGRRGSAATRDQLDDVRDEILAANPSWLHQGGGRNQQTGQNLPELAVTNPANRSQRRFPDLTFRLPDGSSFYVNTVDTYSSGAATIREFEAAVDISLWGDGPALMIPK